MSPRKPIVTMCLLFAFFALPLPALAQQTQDDACFIGWEGDCDAAMSYMNGSFNVRSGRNVLISFGIYTGQQLKWYNHSGYLPCLVTEFERDNCTVKIMNFGDKVNLGSNDYVVAYCRVQVYNHDTVPHTLNPSPNGPLVTLASANHTVQPGQTVNHDYAIGIDRFCNGYNWRDDLIASAGSWDQHFDHMKNFWDGRLQEIMNFEIPDEQLANGFKAAYIYIKIILDGNQPNVGEYGYNSVYTHDAVGIVASLFVVGDFMNGPARLGYLDNTGRIYYDATYKFSWPHALYLKHTNDLGYINGRFNALRDGARKTEEYRNGPNGIMRESWAIDTTGYWMVDDYSALLGFWAYKYICERIGNGGESQWANDKYNALLNATNNWVNDTINRTGINYIPSDPRKSNDEISRLRDNPRDMNWSTLFLMGRWPWDGYLLNAPQSGPIIDLVEETYDYGFARGQNEGGLPEHTFGGWHSVDYSNCYNSGSAIPGLITEKYRSESLDAFKFLLNNATSGPNCFWEGIGWPGGLAKWEGVHPVDGSGDCPHGWGLSYCMKAVADSLYAEKFDGKVIIGRGISDTWLESGQTIVVNNAPATDNRHVGYRLTYNNYDRIDLEMTGDDPANDILIELPILMDRLVSASTGSVDFAAGRVTVPANTNMVSIYLIPQVSDPVVSPDSGLYENQVEVTMTVADPADADIRYTLDGSDPDAGSLPYTGPFTLTDSSTVKAIGVKTGQLDSGIVTREYLVGHLGDGLLGEYYNNTTLSGDPKLKRIDPQVNFPWELGSPHPDIPTDNFSVRWTGYVMPLYTETYTFYTNTDDGVRLWVDGQQLIDKWIDQGPTEWSGQITLNANQNYPIVMEYYEGGVGARAELRWSSTSQVKEIIAQNRLSTVDAPIDPPIAPTNLIATAVSDSQIDLNWIDNAANEAGFRIERKTTGDFALTATVGTDTVSYADTGLSYETTYTYRVYAWNAAGDSGYSNEDAMITLSPPPPPPPTGLATIEGDGTVELSWTASAVTDPAVLYYIVYRSDDAGVTYRPVAVAFGGAPQILDRQVYNGSQYCYKLKAVNMRGLMSVNDSEVICATPHIPPPPPQPPTDLTATASQDLNEIVLAWTDNATNEDGFVIERKTTGDYEIIAEPAADTTGYNDTGLAWDTTYTYRVQAFNESGSSPYSNEASDTTPVPLNPIYTTVDDTYIDITYTGAWGFHDDWSDRYNSTTHESEEVDAYVEFTFTGYEIELIGETQTWGGTAEIFIDDLSYGDVSFNDNPAVQQSIIKVINLANGQHTFKMVNTSGSWIYVDAMIYTHY